jgi:hypothetical protein
MFSHLFLNLYFTYFLVVVTRSFDRSYACSRSTCKGVMSSYGSSSLREQRRLNANATVDDGADSLDCWRLSANKSDVCQSDVLQCTLGATGPLCGSCDDGYFFSTNDLLCQSCSAPKQRTVIFLSLYLIIGAVVVSLYTGILNIPNRMQQTVIFGILNKFDSGTLRVVWSNYQVFLLSYILRALKECKLDLLISFS